MNKFNTISIFGLGYIGLPTACAFALAGKQVIGVEINPQRVNEINQGKSELHEAGLAEALTQAHLSGLLRASTTPEPADAFIIAVPTPLTDRQPDLRFIQAAVESLAPYLHKGNLVVLESTSPVGTTEQVAQWLQQARPDLVIPLKQGQQGDIYLAYCPERVLPSRIMVELYQNDRVIGGINPASAQQAVDLYQIFAKGQCVMTAARTAELCKLVENSYRDVNIAFANELSLICAEWGINFWKLIDLANRHPRVNILQAGAGVGGHCIAVDPWFIVAQSDHARLIRTAREVNDYKPQWVLQQIKLALADCVMALGVTADQLTIACLGLAFKADVGDLRESPAVMITQQLADWHQGQIWAVEPNITALPTELAGKVHLVGLEQALQQADILVLLVDHAPFRAVPADQIQQQWLVDTRGVWQR